MKNLLILGGTGDAVTLARGLADRFGETLSLTTSLAGRTRRPVEPVGEIRVGGFGGAAGLRDYLNRNGITAVIDATHPFAARMTANAIAACEAENIPLSRLDRPEWTPMTGDRWIRVPTLESAAHHLVGLGKAVFLTTGSTELDAFLPMVETHFLLRVIEPAGFSELPENWEVIGARGPFSLQDELALMHRHAVDVLVSKNSGGDAVAAKLVAARQLEIPVVMVDRPAVPAITTVHSVQAAIDWVDRLPK